MSINDEDKLKIQKAKLLFTQKRVENITHLKHILRLAFTFMFNKKFIETKETFEFFANILDNEEIINNFKDLYEPLKISYSQNPNENKYLLTLFEEYSPKLNFDYKLKFKVAICFLKELISEINNCFFSYMKINIYLENRNKNENPQKIFKVIYL